MALSAGDSGRPKAVINVTPMIDILLVLLIIFMMIGTHSTGFDAQVPQPAPEESSGLGQVVITVRGDGMVEINRGPLPVARLEARLKEIYRVRGDRVIFVGAARNLEFEPVIRVIDIARGVGLQHVALMPQ